MSTQLSPNMKTGNEFLKLLSKYGKSVDFQEGDIIVKEKDTSDFVYIVINGKADVLKMDSYGHNMKVATLDKGCIIGEMGAFLDNKRSATVVATESMKVIKFDGIMFQKAMAHIPDLSFKVMATFAERISSLVGLLTTHKRERLMFIVGTYILSKSTKDDHGGNNNVMSIMDVRDIKNDTGLESHKFIDALRNFETLRVVWDLLTHGKENKVVNVKDLDDMLANISIEELLTKGMPDHVKVKDGEVRKIEFKYNIEKMKWALKKLSYVE